MDYNGVYLTTYRDDYRNPYSRSLMKKPPKPPEWTRNNEDTLYQSNCFETFNSDFPLPKTISFQCGDDGNHMEKHLEPHNERQEMIIALHGSDCLTNDIIKALNHSNAVNPGKALESDGCGCVSSVSEERYRDPFPFRLFSVNSAPNYQSPIENVCSGPNFYSRKNMLGISEYMDTISKTGRSTMLAVQQFREPIPSSRRRLEGQQCIQSC